MAIGLSAEELSKCLIDSFFTLQKQVPSIIIKEVSRIDTEELHKQFPNLDSQQLTMLLSLAFALATTISKNNELLAKSIPHIEP